ncbi:DEAD/DEAH box helicase [Megamonas rupellensis]|uniref:DEAD/DEAH box helicase n=1 Tax=Megamonas rupellensis TaxID=491921 RepID=UPI00241E59A5|nr:type ISP restriction/modification enzyme [Megamonas rupellensis]
MSFQQILDIYRKKSWNERNKGERFEMLMKRFLLSYPLYANELKEVWLWNEFPYRKDFGGNDLGIDLVALTVNDEYWSIQCKFYDEKTNINLDDISHFIANSNRKFLDDKGQSQKFSLCLWIDTKKSFGKNAEQLIKNQHIEFKRLGYYELDNASIDWQALANGETGKSVQLKKKTPREHQRKAIALAHEYFKTKERGKFIMACGTGKTYTALNVVEQETNKNGFILFLVPSIALLSQTLKSWLNDTTGIIYPVCICSDTSSSKVKSKNSDSDDTSTIDLPFPATTNVDTAIYQIKQRFIQQSKTGGMVIIFSTYQSIDVVHKIQQHLLSNTNEINDNNIFQSANNTPFVKIEDKSKYIFDMIVCDEAHRTTGIKIKGTDDSAFVKVHDNKFLQAKHRLYMTATPRIYTEEAKKKARQGYAELCSMDDIEKYGEEIYRIGFSEAVEKGLLSDYKVVVLTIGEDQIPASIQNAIADKGTEISTDSASKLIGCINALSKRMTLDSLDLKEVDPGFMHTALAFCSNIKTSKAISNIFNNYANDYYDSLSKEERVKTVNISAKHVDGSMNAIEREEKLQWLKNTNTTNTDCHILTNVRCLSEGVDVPSLDAIIFLSSRNSQVDVVQSVGRVMRRPPANSTYDKKYGYIIIPVVVPPNVEPELALEESKDFSTVWSVLNALRAHDDRFDAKINKIELNKTKPEQILVGGTPEPDGTAYGTKEEGTTETVNEGRKEYTQTTLHFSELQNAIYARMVKKVGTKRYWEDWAKNVAEIARRHKERIEQLIQKGGEHKKAFDKFLKGLHKNINPYISTEDAIDMLSQHMITQPVFEALFENNSFVKNNPISKSMSEILSLLDNQGLEKEREELDKFYKAVKRGCEGVDNAEGKQKIIIELYDKFFRLALKKTVEKLGIVYTPIEVVDFILNSVNDILKKEFGRKHGLSDENVHILDPFTGTGTFITRLLQLGLIRKEDLLRKYTKELHANEIVLLAYYIASINIENTFHDIANQDKYIPFEGICLTDTFQLGEIIANGQKIEDDGFANIWSDMFPGNSQRVIDQKKIPMKVIIGNPPYSVGQRSANDNAQNETYPALEKRMAETYVNKSNATNKNRIYDSYIKAFRWASDRIDNKNGGIVAFVSNAGWLDGSSMDGMRYCFEHEFSSIYIFNLRGNQRTQGETSRREGGKIFGSGSRTPVAITILIKNPKRQNKKAEIYYHDIGDYLSREEKLKIITDFKSCMNSKFPVKVLKPNKQNDWINQRNTAFENYIIIGNKKDKNLKQKFFRNFYSNGLRTNRDFWCYNFSKKQLSDNIQETIKFYNSEVINFQNGIHYELDMNSKKISWSDGLKQALKRKIFLEYNYNQIVKSVYRPYCLEYLYYDKYLNERTYQIPKIFPTANHKNLLICVSGIGGLKNFSVLITNYIPCLDMIEKSQCFPLYYYEQREKVEQSLFDNEQNEYIRHDGITDFIFNQAKELYGNKVTKEDIFFYVYGFLHLPKYSKEFSADLKKSLPRLFLVDEPKVFWQISKAGRDLADIHLNYENQQAPENVIIEGDCGNYTVSKMKFPKKDQKDTIIYNNDITIKNIPLEIYNYLINGRSPVEWIMERYQVKIDKTSGIENNPNDWATEHNQPRYILDLLLSIMTVSLKTQEIVNSLPDVKFE